MAYPEVSKKAVLGRPRVLNAPAVRYVNLDVESIWIARQLGGGNVSRGIREALQHAKPVLRVAVEDLL